MTRIATSAAMRAAEALADNAGVSYAELMERAGTLAAQKIMPSLRPGDGVLILCGKGNNGGDGLVMARVLQSEGYVPAVVFTMGTRLSPLAQHNLELLEETGAAVWDLPLPDGELEHLLGRSALVVDAVFGTGFSGTLPQHLPPLFDAVRSSGLPVVALDAPSGVDLDTGLCDENTLPAAQTLAFACLKPGHLLKNSSGKCGHSTVIDIGITDEQLAQAGAFCRLDRAVASQGLPPRPRDGHKGRFGRLLAVCGSELMSGAALLSCEGALRTGVGMVRLLSDQPVLAAAAVRLPECLLALPECLDESVAWATAALCGCGLSVGAGARRRLRGLLTGFSGPVIIDADGLNLLAEEPELLRLVPGRAVLTPHMGEMARLCRSSVDELVQRHFELASAFARTHRIVLILKDSCTTVAAPDGRMWLFDGGNSGLAKGGSGDVLAGVIASLAAQGADLTKAALSGVWLHGTAADWARAELGEYGMLPSDVVRHLPHAARLLARPE